jgi:hypothetical protein
VLEDLGEDRRDDENKADEHQEGRSLHGERPDPLFVSPPAGACSDRARILSQRATTAAAPTGRPSARKIHL